MSEQEPRKFNLAKHLNVGVKDCSVDVTYKNVLVRLNYGEVGLTPKEAIQFANVLTKAALEASSTELWDLEGYHEQSDSDD